MIHDEDLLPEEDELFEHKRIVTDKGQAPIRIDKFLVDRLEATSRNKIQSAADAGSILVNGKPVKSSYKVRPLDEISVVLAHPPQEYTVEPEEVPLDVMYEDDTVMVINKQAGLVVHPGHGNYHGTLVHGLLFLHSKWPEINGSSRPGIVHRLDKNTSGVMVVGKTEQALSHLAKQFFDRTTERLYEALVWGDMEFDTGTVTGNIGRDPRMRKVFTVFPDGEEGKHAVTHYKVLKRYGYVTHVQCKLETGRTHQIRVHMKFIRHPLFNDYLYGGDRIVCGTVFTKYKQFIDNCFELMPYHTLHAKSLGFAHPQTGKRMFFEVPLPANFQALIDKWARYTEGFNI
jgi:23S rRNA pseudouridine1911/1915/1917 synthase